MLTPKSMVYLLILIFSLNLSGCMQKNDQEPRLGIDESLEIDGVIVTIVETKILFSYSNHYIMKYPAENQAFYAITASFEGLNEPNDALEWARRNFKLYDDINQEQELVHAQWSLIGEDIQYKADEVFSYQYLFLFSVSRDADYTVYGLKLADTQWIETRSILQPVSISLGDSDPNGSEITDTGEVIQQQSNLLSATIGGGSRNSSIAYHTTIAGGHLNTASAAYGSVGGGRENQATNLYSTISGGYGNLASGRDSSIGGGSRNTASNYHATIGGGIRNQAKASDSTIGGGAYNQADDLYATIGGGVQNSASGTAAVIGGGAGNLTSHNQSTIGGGLDNQATGDYAVVSGGYNNVASGDYSNIPGGSQNQAHGNFSFSAGRRSVVLTSHTGAVLFADSIDSDFLSTNPNEFSVRATGGVRFVSAVDSTGNPSAGVILPPGGGSWSNLSDRKYKENVLPIDTEQILESLTGLPLFEWNYVSQDPSIRHIGPMADDFYVAFNIGEDPDHISNVDSDGISLAAIQGLHHLIEEKNQQVSDLDARISRLERLHSLLLTSLMVSIVLLFLVSVIFISSTRKGSYFRRLDQPGE